MVFLSFFVTASCNIVLNTPVNYYYTLNSSEAFNISVTGSNETFTGRLMLNDVSAGEGVCLNNTYVVFVNNYTPSVGLVDWYIYAFSGDLDNCTSSVRRIRFGSYKSEAVDNIGNLAHDFGKLFMDDMPDLVIGIMVLGMIVFFGVILRNTMKKSTN